jgi:hypothetical protein
MARIFTVQRAWACPSAVETTKINPKDNPRMAVAAGKLGIREWRIETSW